MMQARWGSHGDYQAIALAPNSPQECFDLAIKAFNLSETYRVPVFLMMDECVGHMTERVVIPRAEEITIVPRRWYRGPVDAYEPFRAGSEMVPPMVRAGEGYKIHVTGLTHDERGYPAMTVAAQERLVRRLYDKIRTNVDAITDYVEDQVEGADIVVITYGITSRTALPAIEQARREGLKVGHLRLIVVWPFPEKQISALAEKVRAIVVPELNMGQVVLEVERCVHGAVPVTLVGHTGGTVHQPAEIYEAIISSLKGA
jgi:2-oxoglutarate ferredoxin oxidoreductase subunit alpha